MMRLALIALMLTLMVASPASAYSLPKPQLYAVYFTADWCPNCKVLTPIWAKARADEALFKKPVLFVTLDLTAPASIYQSSMLATALGIAPYVQRQGSGTGYVALLAADRTTEITRFDRTSTAEGIVKAITSALAAPATTPASPAKP